MSVAEDRSLQMLDKAAEAVKRGAMVGALVLVDADNSFLILTPLSNLADVRALFLDLTNESGSRKASLLEEPYDNG